MVVIRYWDSANVIFWGGNPLGTAEIASGLKIIDLFKIYHKIFWLARDQLVKHFENFTTNFVIMGSDKGDIFSWGHHIQISNLRLRLRQYANISHFWLGMWHNMCWVLASVLFIGYWILGMKWIRIVEILINEAICWPYGSLYAVYRLCPVGGKVIWYLH